MKEKLPIIYLINRFWITSNTNLWRFYIEEYEFETDGNDVFVSVCWSSNGKCCSPI